MWPFIEGVLLYYYNIGNIIYNPGSKFIFSLLTDQMTDVLESKQDKVHIVTNTAKSMYVEYASKFIRRSSLLNLL